MSALPLTAQSPPPPPSGAQALVLSTGASRGFSHAGVLAALDSLGYDPDIVVGASMGAIIGALYASGYAPAEIWRMASSTEWGAVFRNPGLVLGPERRVHTPSLVMGVNLAPLEVSRGFVSDRNVNQLLVHLLFAPAAAARSDFDRLPRRYRAVVADMENGEEIVIAKGDLARAVRASMGTPGFFSVIEWDGRLVADGGVANYLPISVARSMGASYVVASDASRAHPPIRRTDPTALSGRALSLLMRAAIEDTTADVLIEPDLHTDFSGAVFPSDLQPIYRLGWDATLAGARPETRARSPRAVPGLPDSLVELRVETSDPTLEPLVRRIFRDVAPAKFSVESVLDRVDRLYASGLVDGVWPRVEGSTPAANDAGPAAGDVLIVRVDPVPRRTLSAGVGYDNDRGGRAWGALQHRVSLGSVPVEQTLAGGLNGIERWAEASLRAHAFPTPTSITAGLTYSESDVRNAWLEEPGSAEVSRAGGWFGLERRTALPGRTVVLGVSVQRVDVHDVSPDPQLDLSGLAEGREPESPWRRGNGETTVGPFLRFGSLDSPPLIVGLAPEISFEWRAGDVSYGSASLRTSRAIAAGRVSVAVTLEAAATVGDPPPDALPALGDRHRLPGMRWGEERGRGVVIAGLDAAHPILAAGLLRARIRAGNALTEQDELGSWGSWAAGVALEGVWNLPFGSVQVGWGINTRGGQRVEVSLGPTF